MLVIPNSGSYVSDLPSYVERQYDPKKGQMIWDRRILPSSDVMYQPFGIRETKELLPGGKKLIRLAGYRANDLRRIVVIFLI
jgi:hypothetical protein